MVNLFLIIVIMTITYFLMLSYVKRKYSEKKFEILENSFDELYQKALRLSGSKFELEKENIELKYKVNVEKNKNWLYKQEIDKLCKEELEKFDKTIKSKENGND